MKKFAIAATALALVATTITAVPANAAAVPASKAQVLSECSTVGQKAAKKGADGSDLICQVAKVGSMKGKKIWMYKDLPVLKELEMIIPNTLTSGFGGFGKAVADAMKAEGLVKTEPVLTAKPGAGNLPGLVYMINDMKGKAGKIGVTGFAQVGSAFTAKSPYRVSDATPIARMMGEYEVVAVKADSPYKTIADLVAALKKDAKAEPVVGGTLGGVDTFTAARILEAIEVPLSQLNYTVNNGGVAASLLSDAKYTWAISGYGDFDQYVKAGTIRVLGVTAPKRVTGISAPTFKESGVNVVVENWRGLILPPGTPAAARSLVIRALDVAVKSKSFKDYLTSQKAFQLFMPGNTFSTWLKGQESSIRKLYLEAGLGQ